MDLLIFSTDFNIYPFLGLSENHVHNYFALEPAGAPERESLVKMSKHSEHIPETSESPEQKQAKSGKVNLRKSLAWDSAFFTSEGTHL